MDNKVNTLKQLVLEAYFDALRAHEMLIMESCVGADSVIAAVYLSNAKASMCAAHVLHTCMGDDVSIKENEVLFSQFNTFVGEALIWARSSLIEPRNSTITLICFSISLQKKLFRSMPRSLSRFAVFLSCFLINFFVFLFMLVSPRFCLPLPGGVMMLLCCEQREYFYQRWQSKSGAAYQPRLA